MLNGDGEALLHRNFHDIARYAARLRLPNVYFNTNGTLLTPAFIDEFITYFTGSVNVSLDGFKESHERLRVGSSYEKVVGHTEYLLAAVKSAGANIKVSVSYCNYDQPDEEREEFVKYWVEKVDAVSIGEVYDKNYRIISKRLNSPENSRRLRCGVPWETFIIRHDGRVVPCSNCFALGWGWVQYEDIVLGDANEESLADIWKGKKFERLRARVLRDNFSGTICESCERWNMYACFPDEIQDRVKITRTGVFTTFRKLPLPADEKGE